MNEVTRRSPEMEKYVEIRPVVMESYPDAHNVFLKVTNQSFCVTQYACETKEGAEWMRDMLCVALAKIVSDSIVGLSEAELDHVINAWNAAHPIGTPVSYRFDDNSIKQTETRTEAQVLSGHTPVIWLNGISGCVLLDRVAVLASPVKGE